MHLFAPWMSVLLWTGSMLAATDGYGPLRGGDRNPLIGLFYLPRPEAGWLLEPGARRFELNLGYSNIFEVAAGESWAQDVDMEQLVTTLHLRQGFRGGFEAGLTLSISGRWSGFLDSAIQSYHDALGLPNDRRDEFANHRFSFAFGPIDGAPLFRGDDQGFEIDAPEVFARARLARWRGGGLAGRVTVKAGLDDRGSGETDGALELSASQTVGRARVHGHLAAIRLGVPSGWEPILDETSMFASLGAEIPWRRFAIQVQVDAFDGYLENTGLKTLDPVGLDLIVGLAGTAGHWQWQIGFAEDLTGEGPAVDFTLDLHLSRRF